MLLYGGLRRADVGLLLSMRIDVCLGSSVAHEVGEEVEVVGSWHCGGGREVGHGWLVGGSGG